MEREVKGKNWDVDIEFLILEVGLAPGGWGPRRLRPRRGGNWRKRRGADLKDLTVPELTWRTWLTWKSWFKDGEKSD